MGRRGEGEKVLSVQESVHVGRRSVRCEEQDLKVYLEGDQDPEKPFREINSGPDAVY